MKQPPTWVIALGPGIGIIQRGIERQSVKAMTDMKPYTVYYRYKNPGDKKHGPVRRFSLYANSVEEARLMATRYANYPNIEIIRIRQT